MPEPARNQGKTSGEVILDKGMPTWEKVTWILIVIYILIVAMIFWVLGWKTLGFPL
jgi:hypothetical protein